LVGAPGEVQGVHVVAAAENGGIAAHVAGPGHLWLQRQRRAREGGAEEGRGGILRRTGNKTVSSTYFLKKPIQSGGKSPTPCGGSIENDTGHLVRPDAKHLCARRPRRLGRLVSVEPLAQVWQRDGLGLHRDGSARIGPGVPRLGFGGAWLTGPGTYGPPPDL